MKKYQPQANIEKHLNKQHPQNEQKQQQQQHAEEKPVAKPINAWQASEEAKHNACVIYHVILNFIAFHLAAFINFSLHLLHKSNCRLPELIKFIQL